MPERRTSGESRNEGGGTSASSAASSVVSRGLLRSKTDKLMLVRGRSGGEAPAVIPAVAQFASGQWTSTVVKPPRQRPQVCGG
jgi:hypothetical protein